MSYYRRSKTAGGSYFFILITYRRRSLFTNPESRRILHDMIIEVRNEYPFQIDALVLLPEHLHCIWTLPMDRDAKDFCQHIDYIHWNPVKHGLVVRANCKIAIKLDLIPAKGE